MFEKEAENYFRENAYNFDELTACRECMEFGYNKGKEELTERLDEAIEIIEQMKDLFFDCWQEKGYNAIKFEQKVNDFLKENK